MRRALPALFWVITAVGFSSGLKAQEPTQRQLATFAGGCFWCMEPPFRQAKGVLNVTSGFMGGKKPNPTYAEVSRGGTGYLEVVQISFDPNQVSYKALLEIYWRQIDPTDAEGQFVDRGESYRPQIFVHNAEQRRLAEESIKRMREAKIYSKSLKLEVREASAFYAAEEYHQDYARKNPIRYKYYRGRSGRDEFLKSIWQGRENYRIWP